MATKDGIRFFRIGSNIPTDAHEALLGWLESAGTIADLEPHLLQYETLYAGDEANE
jgi:hypothetical protein